MPKRSTAFKRIILVLSALAVLGAAVWIGMRVLEPVPVPPIPPPRARATFDIKADIRQNPLFNTLRGIVTGEIEPGALGKLNPFVGPVGAAQTAVGGASNLGLVEEIPLGGSGAIAASPGKDGSMLVLLEGKVGTDRVYEVRRFKAEGSVDTLVNWTLKGGEDANGVLVPNAFAQDQNGMLWFVSAVGRVAYADASAIPSWSAAPLMSLTGVEIQVRFDGNGRMWVSDRNKLYGGDGNTFEAYDLTQFLAEEKRQYLEAKLLTEESMAPKSFQILKGGRLGVLTTVASIVLPLAPPQQSVVFDFIPTSTESALPGTAWGQAPNGDFLYSSTDGAVKLTRLSVTGTRTYDDPYVLPRGALQNPYSLTKTDANALYALDYTPTSTVLWTLRGEEWAAHVVAASGTLPNDVPLRVEPDSAGNVWVIMKQRGLLRVGPRRSVGL